MDEANTEMMAQTSIKYLLDGLIPLEYFMEIRSAAYQQSDARLYCLNRTQAFTLEFTQHLSKAYQKLRSFNYSFDTHTGLRDMDNTTNDMVQQILRGQTEGYIMSMRAGLEMYEASGRGGASRYESMLQSKESAAKKLTFKFTHASTAKKPINTFISKHFE